MSEEQVNNFDQLVNDHIKTVDKLLDDKIKSFNTRTKWTMILITSFLGLATFIMEQMMRINSENTKQIIINTGELKQLTNWKEYVNEKMARYEDIFEIISKKALSKERFELTMSLSQCSDAILEGLIEHNDVMITRARERASEIQNKLEYLNDDNVTRGFEIKK
jgi:hypothetical protein